jgi:hypothetical protein
MGRSTSSMASLNPCSNHIPLYHGCEIHIFFVSGMMLGTTTATTSGIVDKAKIEVIEKLPPPTNVKGIHNFLGHAELYRRFIQNFSQIARPLTYLLAKDSPFIFMEECLQAFQTLKKALISTPIIQSLD